NPAYLPSFPTRRSSDLAEPSRNARRPCRGSLAARVHAARVSDAQRRPHGVALADRRGGLELQVRPGNERRGCVRQLPAKEAELRSEEHTSELQSRVDLV